jgi:nickel superoxide dismutase
MKKALIVLTALCVSLAFAAPAFAHCEIPCGIYDDEMRLKTIAEHIATIEKSMQRIRALSGAGQKNYNQIVRWVDNKDEHATQIQHIVSQYFMAQRIKPVKPDEDRAGHQRYVRMLTLLHGLQLHAMTAKQTVDLNQVEILRSLLASFERAYFEQETEQEKPRSIFEELERRLK